VSHRRPEPVEVVDYDPTWPGEFERLKSQLDAALGDDVIQVEHVGSTAVPGLAAKPVVDLYAVVEDVDRATASLRRLGYVPEGELGVPGRLGFAWPEGDKRHHLYICTPDHVGLETVVRFRDYMRTHPQQACQYADLKRGLARRYRDDRDAYAAGKEPFIAAALERAGRAE
jgi:GrpB-like predicted nucleotidyltransferase (UPF0157 family)